MAVWLKTPEVTDIRKDAEWPLGVLQTSAVFESHSVLSQAVSQSRILGLLSIPVTFLASDNTAKADDVCGRFVPAD